MHDVYSISEPELLAFIPRPALALLLVFPVSATYESARLAEDAGVEEYKGKGKDEPVVWWRQTIRNACGLMGLLHAVANGPAKGFIGEFFPFFSFSLYTLRMDLKRKSLFYITHPFSLVCSTPSQNSQNFYTEELTTPRKGNPPLDPSLAIDSPPTCRALRAA
jgi:hypothetical protein